MTKAKAGLIGIVGDEAKQDYWGTMRRVAEIGYTGIEGEGPLLTGDVAENMRRFHDLGLEVLTVSASRDQLRDEPEKILANAKAVGAPRATVWWGPCETKDAVLRDAELYNAAGSLLAADGVMLCYHNHEHEFQRSFNGVYALDVLVEHTDPAALAFEIDVAWVTFGGENPIKVLKRLAGRVPAIHVKDLYGLEKRGDFTSVGTGLVDIKGSVETAIALGIEWVVVEQDTLRNLTAFETATISYLYLKEAGLV